MSLCKFTGSCLADLDVVNYLYMNTTAGIGIYKLATGGEPEKYSSKWFENASDELLKAEREVVRKNYCASGDDFSAAVRWEKLLHYFDKVISKRAWAGKEYGFPVRSEHGWHLPSDD